MGPISGRAMVPFNRLGAGAEAEAEVASLSVWPLDRFWTSEKPRKSLSPCLEYVISKATKAGIDDQLEPDLMDFDAG